MVIVISTTGLVRMFACHDIHCAKIPWRINVKSFAGLCPVFYFEISMFVRCSKKVARKQFVVHDNGVNCIKTHIWYLFTVFVNCFASPTNGVFCCIRFAFFYVNYLFSKLKTSCYLRMIEIVNIVTMETKIFVKGNGLFCGVARQESKKYGENVKQFFHVLLSPAPFYIYIEHYK